MATLTAFLVISFLVGFGLSFKGKSTKTALIASSLLIPGLVLFEEFFLPYQGGGASMWPIAVLFGGFYGCIAGGLGVFACSRYMRKKND